MADAPSFLLAFAAGFVSFVSPRCLPLVPGYLATVAGPGRDATARRLTPELVGRSALFILVRLNQEWRPRALGWFRRHHAGVLGLVIYENQLFRINIEVQQALEKADLNFFQSL